MEMPKRTKVAQSTDKVLKDSADFGAKVKEIVLNTPQPLRFKGGGQPKGTYSEADGFEMHLNKSGSLVYIDDKKDEELISFIGLTNILRGTVYR